jgi:hypothetical protein
MSAVARARFGGFAAAHGGKPTAFRMTRIKLRGYASKG